MNNGDFWWLPIFTEPRCTTYYEIKVNQCTLPRIYYWQTLYRIPNSSSCAQYGSVRGRIDLCIDPCSSISVISSIIILVNFLVNITSVSLLNILQFTTKNSHKFDYIDVMKPLVGNRMVVYSTLSHMVSVNIMSNIYI